MKGLFIIFSITMASKSSSRDVHVARTSQVLTQATLEAARRLEVLPKELARILGVSEASLSRLATGKRVVDPQDKEGELAVLFVRLYRSLHGVLGGHEKNARRWMRAFNSALNGVPAQLIERVEGLVRTVEYLDAFRARV